MIRAATAGEADRLARIACRMEGVPHRLAHAERLARARAAIEEVHTPAEREAVWRRCGGPRPVDPDRCHRPADRAVAAARGRLAPVPA